MWNLVQCAVKGLSHIKTGVPCQDKTYAYQGNGVTVVALADGAGSAKMSHYGAEHITQYMCLDLAQNFQNYFQNPDGIAVKVKLMEQIRNQLHALAKELDCEFRDLASTLLLAAVWEGNYILLHIGDGVIGYSKDGELKVASHPENGEFVNTTVFTTSKDALQTMKLMKGKLGTIDGFLLMSDGTEASLYNKRQKTLAVVLSRLMQNAAEIEPSAMNAQLEDSFLEVVRKSTTDDCSMVMMVEDSGRFPGYQNLTVNEKRDLLHIHPNATAPRKQSRRYDQILALLVTPQSLRALSRKIHLKPRYTRKHLEKLLDLNLIEERNDLYHTIVVFNKYDDMES